MRLCRESYNKPARVHIYIVFGTALEVRRSFFMCVSKVARKRPPLIMMRKSISGEVKLCVFEQLGNYKP